MEPETLRTIYILYIQGTKALEIRRFSKQFIRVIFPINILDCIRKLTMNSMTKANNKDKKRAVVK